MPKFVEPKVYRIAQTMIHEPGLQGMLAHVGVPDWVTDAKDDHSKLAEVSGRLCYMSFEPGLNKNVTKIREGNELYMANIQGQRHGSVTEHATVTYAIMDVSRVFTHELVRHRVGTAFSQLSGRYVRLDQLRFWYPNLFVKSGTPEQQEKSWHVSERILLAIEDGIAELTSIWEVDTITEFSLKKKITSALRRWAPNGGTNHIIITANHRMWRYMIEQRTSEGAEEEIRYVFGTQIFPDLSETFPAMYQDHHSSIINGYPAITFANRKI